MTKKEKEFLRESNAIEGVYDDASLKQAIIAWDYLIAQEELTPSVVLKTHKLLMLHSALRPDEKGYFRTIPVYIGGKRKDNQGIISLQIESWCDDMARGDTNAKTMHIIYESIHPFVDGNGRTGRMFMNWQYKVQDKKPIIIIKEEEKQEYYKWFR